MKKCKTMIMVLFVILYAASVVGCASTDKHSVKEIIDYTTDNKGYLLHMSDLASGILSADNWRMYKGDDGLIYLYMEEYGDYLPVEQIETIDKDLINEIQLFFDSTFVDSIYYSKHESFYTDKKDGNVMCIRGDGLGDIYYYIYFSEQDDIDQISNPFEYYDDGGFKKKLYYDKNAVRWVSDHRYDLLHYNKGLVKYEVYLEKATDGIWVCRCRTSYPFFEFLIFV